MVTLVQKYGGTSVETPHHLLDAAHRILEEKRRGRRLIVVVSAMGQTTDELVALAHRVSPTPPRREMDMLLTAGERISMALLAMALDSLGAPSISFTGSQSGIITDELHSDARIVAIRPFRIEEALSQDRIVIVAGFQGVSDKKEVTTLGRGGSDTTAVALAIRFDSPWCEIYTDVHGVLTADPRLVPAARTIPRISYETAITLSHLGAAVLFRRSVILARKYNMPIRVLCALSRGAETWIGNPPVEGAGEAPMEMPVETPMESDRILSVALEDRCAWVEIEGVDPRSMAKLSAMLDGVSPWLWIDTHGSRVAGVCVGPGPDEAILCDRILADGTLAEATIRVRRDVAVASLVGEGILARPGILGQAYRTLTEGGFEIIASRTSSLSVSFLLERTRAAEAVRVLHERFVEQP